MRNRDKYNSLVKLLGENIFWEYHLDKLDYKRDRQKIIERIALYGTENDEKIMYKLYSPKTLKKCLVNSLILNDRVIGYYALMLNVREDKFKCFMKTPVQMSF